MNPRKPDVLVSTIFIINQHLFGLKVFFHYSVVSKGVMNAFGRASVLSSICLISVLLSVTTQALTQT